MAFFSQLHGSDKCNIYWLKISHITLNLGKYKSDPSNLLKSSKNLNSKINPNYL